jgi:hypothetical protein
MIMKKIAIVIAALAMSATAFAKTPDVPNTVTVQGKTIQRATVAPEEFRDIGGRYELENGKTLSITQQQNRFYVEVAGMNKTEVVPTSATQFIAKDHSIELKFQTSDSGFSTKVKAKYLVATN